MKTGQRFLLGLGLGLAFAASSTSAAPMGTAFTYQGFLEDSGGPVTNTAPGCDFEFELYPVAAGGTKIDGTQAVSGVSVEDGLFTVTIDFGSGAFNGDARWLAISVCCPSPGCTLEALVPRVELTPAPQAIRAWEGVGPPNALEVDTTTGFVGIGTTNPGSTLEVNGPVHSTSGGFKFPDTTIQTTAAVPDGDTLASLACANGEIAKWNNVSAQWECAADNTGGGGGSTLDGAYDGGGAGAGRTIVADAGAVNIQGPDGLTVLGTITAGSTITINGTAGSERINSTDDLELHVSSGRALRLETNGASPNIIGGHPNNSAESEVIGGTVAGGGGTTSPNSVTANFATVGGGIGNTAGGGDSTVGGGSSNTAEGGGTTVGGGSENLASGISATVGGGVGNIASGISATVGGGESNTAGGDYSFAAGRGATVRDAAASGDANGDEGTFVWSDGVGGHFTSTGHHQFLIRASGGVAIGTNDPAGSVLRVVAALSGDLSVELPADAISASEMLNEPGVAGVGFSGTPSVVLDGTIQTLASETITVPTSGFVLAIGTATARMLHTLNNPTRSFWGVNNSAGAFLNSGDITIPQEAPGTGSFSFYLQIVTVQSVFPVSAGANTIFFLARELSGVVEAHDINLTLLFFPTSYETVTATAGAGDAPAPNEEVIRVSGAELSDGLSASPEPRGADAVGGERELSGLLARMEARIASLEQQWARLSPTEGEEQIR